MQTYVKCVSATLLKCITIYSQNTNNIHHAPFLPSCCLFAHPTLSKAATPFTCHVFTGCQLSNGDITILCQSRLIFLSKVSCSWTSKVRTNARHVFFIMRFTLNAKSNSFLCGNRTSVFPVDKGQEWEAAQVACSPAWNGVQLLISFVCYSIAGWRGQGRTGGFSDPPHHVRGYI